MNFDQISVSSSALHLWALLWGTLTPDRCKKMLCHVVSSACRLFKHFYERIFPLPDDMEVLQGFPYFC